MKHIEDDLQMSCVRWFKYQYPNVIMFHCPNGGRRDAREGARFKAMGVMPGVADLFVMKSTYDGDFQTGYFGLFIELKSPKGTITESQRVFQAYCIDEGYKYEVCRSLDEFIKCVNDYLT